MFTFLSQLLAILLPPGGVGFLLNVTFALYSSYHILSNALPMLQKTSTY
jgi:hypothetical protein